MKFFTEIPLDKKSLALYIFFAVLNFLAAVLSVGGLAVPLILLWLFLLVVRRDSLKLRGTALASLIVLLALASFIFYVVTTGHRHS